MIASARIKLLVDESPRPEADYVLYWMQNAQRTRFNPALELAIEEADALRLPVLVAFALTAFPEANARHYDFMLRGLAEVRRALAGRGIGFVIRKQAPEALIADLAPSAALVVCDRGYLKIQRTWRDRLARALAQSTAQSLAQSTACRLIQVEGDVVVPLETASPKHEYAARTLRPRLHRLWDDFLQDMPPRTPARPFQGPVPASDVELEDVPKLLKGLKIDQEVGPVRRFPPGETAAQARLDAFLEDGLGRYSAERGRPEGQAASHLSPYLHYGQISPVDIALRVRGTGSDVASYLEELIVRRELSMNHVFYEPAYDRYEAMPDWARKTLAAHAGDPRPHLYDRAQFEAGQTHDPYWNAAMGEMRATGYMHNTLRMYWGKKILQWSASPQEAFETTLALNNRWFLDGRDANSFTNVGWLYGLHDRPWGSQPVFGTVRSMGPNTFKKFDADAYVRDVAALAAAETA